MSESLRTSSRPAVRPTPSDAASTDTLATARDQGNARVRAAQNAINRALSGDSERFQAAARQRGGQ